MLNHPNVLHMVGVSDPPHHSIVFRKISKNLHDIIYDEKLYPLSELQVVRLALGIAAGMKYLHTPLPSKPMIVHRMLQSSHIWVTNGAYFVRKSINTSPVG